MGKLMSPQIDPDRPKKVHLVTNHTGTGDSMSIVHFTFYLKTSSGRKLTYHRSYSLASLTKEMLEIFCTTEVEGKYKPKNKDMADMLSTMVLDSMLSRSIFSSRAVTNFQHISKRFEQGKFKGL